MIALGADHGGYFLKEEIKKHLEDMGFVTGAVVTVVSAISGNLIVNVKDSKVALDKQLAGKIMI